MSANQDLVDLIKRNHELISKYYATTAALSQHAGLLVELRQALAFATTLLSTVALEPSEYDALTGLQKEALGQAGSSLAEAWTTLGKHEKRLEARISSRKALINAHHAKAMQHASHGEVHHKHDSAHDHLHSAHAALERLERIERQHAENEVREALESVESISEKMAHARHHGILEAIAEIFCMRQELVLEGIFERHTHFLRELLDEYLIHHMHLSIHNNKDHRDELAELKAQQDESEHAAHIAAHHLEHKQKHHKEHHEIAHLLAHQHLVKSH